MAHPVLRYRLQAVSRSKVRRHFRLWRQEQAPPLPDRCDNPKCHFHTAPLVWNGEPLSLILDHRDGNKRDNSPHNLRFLCPNCDAQQLSTRGGANRGRVSGLTENGYTLNNRDGTRIVAATAGAQGRATSNFVGSSRAIGGNRSEPNK